MSHATFSAADMTIYCGLEELGLVAVGMRCQGGGFVLKCRAANPVRLCPGCGRPGYSLGSRTRRLAHEPRGHQPTTLAVYVGRYHCRACSRSWCDDISQVAPPRAKLSFGALRWGLVCLIADNMSMNRIAAHLAVAWHTANEAILAYGEELLLADSTRFEGVRVIGVDEHVWRHRGGDRYATVIVDLTPVRDHTGPARLLDVVQGSSKRVLSSWLAARPQEWKDNIEIVAMDGFSGYKSAAASQLPGAVTVMDPFHVVHIAIDALEQCRQRVQQETLGHRGRKGDPLYAARKTLLTGTDILADTSQARLDAVFACPDHADVHATWRIYQDLLAAYRDRPQARQKHPPPSHHDAHSPGLATHVHRASPHGQNLHTQSRGHHGLHHTTPTPATAPPKPSTHASNTSAASPKDSSTTETTAYAASSTPADSNTSYTLKCEEPVMAPWPPVGNSSGGPGTTSLPRARGSANR